jgi:hypothetical protein
MTVPKPRDCKCKLTDHLSTEEQEALGEIIQQHLDEHEYVFEYHEGYEVYGDPADPDPDRTLIESAEDYVVQMHQQLTQTHHLLAVKKKLEGR